VNNLLLNDNSQTLYLFIQCSFFDCNNYYVKSPGADPGFCVRGTKVGEGSGDRLRSPAGPGLSPGRGPGGISPRKLLGFEYLGNFSVNNFEAFCECDEVY
jgi:hypothetical protein